MSNLIQRFDITVVDAAGKTQFRRTGMTERTARGVERDLAMQAKRWPAGWRVFRGVSFRPSVLPAGWRVLSGEPPKQDYMANPIGDVGTALIVGGIAFVGYLLFSSKKTRPWP